MCRWISFRTVGAAIALVLALSACVPDPEEERVAQHGLVEESRGSLETESYNDVLDVVDVKTAARFRVLRPVTLLRAELDEAPPEVEVVAARITFVESPVRQTYSGFMGFQCAMWPVRRWGPLVSYPAEGLELQSGERLAVNLFVRAAKPGTWTVKGVRLTYRDTDGTERTQVSRTFTGIMVRVTDAQELPADVPRCKPKDGYGWFVDTGLG